MTFSGILPVRFKCTQQATQNLPFSLRWGKNAHKRFKYCLGGAGGEEGGGGGREGNSRYKYKTIKIGLEIHPPI